MSETLKTRVGQVIAGHLHALLDHLEGQAPEVMMAQALRDADGVVDEVRQALGKVSANRHLAQRQHAALNSQHVVLSAQIDQALVSDRDDLAQAGIARQLDIEAQLPVLESTLADYAQQEAELQRFVAALQAKKREMQTALSEYANSRAATESNSGSQSMAAGSPLVQTIDRVSSAFDRIYQRQTGLSATTHASPLQRAAQLKALDELIRDNQIAERLAQRKASQS